MDTLTVVFLKNGETKSAQRAIEWALVMAPGNVTMRYHSAMIDSVAGERESAIKTLKTVLDEGADFPEMEMAIKLLAQLKS